MADTIIPERPVPIQNRVLDELREAIQAVAVRYPDVLRSLVLGVDWHAGNTDQHIGHGLLMTPHGAVTHGDEIAGAAQVNLNMQVFILQRMEELTSVMAKELSGVSGQLATKLEAQKGATGATG
jgi:hypothetical protein